MEENGKTMRALLKEGSCQGISQEERIRELFVRLPKEQEGYWEWTDLETEDMDFLEHVMRQWEADLEVLKAMPGQDLEYRAAAMHFDVLNASLFYINEMPEEAAEETRKAAQEARSILGYLKENTAYDSYAFWESWNCIKVLWALYELQGKQDTRHTDGRDIDFICDYLEKWKRNLTGDAGKCEQAARWFWAASAAQNRIGDSTRAEHSIGEAAALYWGLYKQYRNGYAFAMAVQMEVFRYIQLLAQGKADLDAVCALEKKQMELFHLPDGSELTQRIAEETGILIWMYRGFVYCAEREYSAAHRLFEKAEKSAGVCAEYFEQLGASENSWLAEIGKSIAGQMKTSRMSCVIQMAECSYFLRDGQSARSHYEKGLSLILEYQNLIPEPERLRTQSQMYAMLGDICTQQGDVEQAVCYLDQHVEISRAAAEKNGTIQDWERHVHGCLFAMELQKNLRHIEEAREYAGKGIQACCNIRSMGGGSELDSLERKFERMLSKKTNIFQQIFFH